MEPWTLPHTRKSWRRVLISSSIHALKHKLTWVMQQDKDMKHSSKFSYGWVTNKTHETTWRFWSDLIKAEDVKESVTATACLQFGWHNQQLSLRAITFSQRPGGLGLLCKWSLDLHYEMQTWQICNKQDIRKRPNTFWLHCLFSCQMAESQFTATAGNTASHRLHCSGENCEYVNLWLLCGNTDIPAAFQGNYYEELHIITHTELR